VKSNTTEPQPDQLSKFWIEQILRLTHFYKPSTQLVYITHTHGGGPQLPFHSKISRRVSQKPKTALQTSTSPRSTRFREFWIDSFLRIDLFLNSYYYCFLISLLLTKLLDCLVVSRLLKFALSRLISLNFASLLDKISAQQASKDTSTEAHTHQNTKNNQHTSKTLQKHHFQRIKA